jgi:hypothetical protein
MAPSLRSPRLIEAGYRAGREPRRADIVSTALGPMPSGRARDSDFVPALSSEHSNGLLIRCFGPQSTGSSTADCCRSSASVRSEPSTEVRRTYVSVSSCVR